MSMPATEDVTNGEIVRTLRGLQEEIRALRGEHVRRDLYEAHRAAMEAEIARIRTECITDTRELAQRLDRADEDRAAKRWQVLVSMGTAGLSLVVGLILLIAR